MTHRGKTPNCHYYKRREVEKKDNLSGLLAAPQRGRPKMVELSGRSTDVDAIPENNPFKGRQTPISVTDARALSAILAGMAVKRLANQHRLQQPSLVRPGHTLLLKFLGAGTHVSLSIAVTTSRGLPVSTKGRPVSYPSRRGNASNFAAGTRSSPTHRRSSSHSPVSVSITTRTSGRSKPRSRQG